jgi:hypothetical protein
MTDYNALHCEAAAYARANAAEERVRVLENEIALWREYEQFLLEQNEVPIRIAAAHGWCCPPDVFERGREHRKRLGIERER